MKFTKIKRKGKKLERHELEQLCEALVCKLAKSGYITYSEIRNSQSISLSNHSSSFKINTEMLGHNARYNPHRLTKLGYTRCNTPTWDQRVDYNNIVNDVLNQYELTCKVTSGCYLIRDGWRSFTECDWHNQTPSWEHHNRARGFYVEAI